MKKSLALALALMMILSLAACGGKSEEKPSGSIGDIGSGGVESTTEGGTNSNIPDIGETKVETKSDRIVTTMNDGAGNLAVTEQIYKDNALNDFDFWTIYDPTLDNDAMYEAMNSQLTAAGFPYEEDMVGRHVWFMDVDGEHKGILFWPDDDEMPDGYYILMMTYAAN